MRFTFGWISGGFFVPVFSSKLTSVRLLQFLSFSKLTNLFSQFYRFSFPYLTQFVEIIVKKFIENDPRCKRILNNSALLGFLSNFLLK